MVCRHGAKCLRSVMMTVLLSYYYNNTKWIRTDYIFSDVYIVLGVPLAGNILGVTFFGLLTSKLNDNILLILIVYICQVKVAPVCIYFEGGWVTFYLYLEQHPTYTYIYYINTCEYSISKYLLYLMPHLLGAHGVPFFLLALNVFYGIIIPFSGQHVPFFCLPLTPPMLHLFPLFFPPPSPPLW